MCGIVGYTGSEQETPILLKGLGRLEYRGYDSAGIAVIGEQGELQICKAKGRLSNLEDRVAKKAVPGTTGIAHTRWATHGEPSDVNAHPHFDENCEIAVVHNGIIENYLELKEMLIDKGYKFRSETDTEEMAHLLRDNYNGNMLETIGKVIPMIKGSYAFGIVCKDEPDTIYCTRKDSQLIVGKCEHGTVLASDIPAILEYTRDVYLMEESEIAKMTPDDLTFYDLAGNAHEKKSMHVDWNVEAAEKGGYEHFMLKEIHEQPEALKNTILPRMLDRLPDFRDDGIPDSLFAECSQVRIIACGTAMHAGMVAKALMEPMLRIPVTVSIASEFRYEDPLIDSSTLVIVISQSGETIDTLAAMNLAKSLGSVTLSIVNVKGSTIARESDYVLYTHAGPEIAVASTKAYSVQLAALYMIGCRMALVRGAFGQDEAREFMTDLMDVIPAMETVIGQSEFIQSFVRHLIRERDTFFIGRGLDYAFSLEGALKLKEISYIHAEAYAAGELKHGTIALIYDNVPVIAIATQDHVFAKTISNIREVKARGAYVILLAKKQSVVEDGVADIELRIPDLEDRFTVFPIAVALQLIAYYASIGKHLDVDQPRNLAKSVTVE